MYVSKYIDSESFEWILHDLNYQDCDARKKSEILKRAVGSFESDMAKKFVVPLLADNGSPYANSPEWARNKVLNCLKAKVREILGYDKNRQLTGTIESTEKFINIHGIEYKEEIKTLLDPMIDFGFKLLKQAEDAQTPVQSLGLARANNSVDPDEPDGRAGLW
jgi:hypothetical protein